MRDSDTPRRHAASKHGLRVLLAFVALAALGVVLVPTGSAKPSTKNYDAFVLPVGPPSGGTATFTLTLKNESNSQQTLGSANFIAPADWTLPAFTDAATSSVNDFNWTVCSGDGTSCGTGDNNNVVLFRADTNGDALAPGESVSDTVTANVVCPTTPTAADSTWTTEAKQQNDFSGTGNDFFLKLADLEPLGGFSFAVIPTQTTNVSFGISITATDTCGATKTDYNGAGLYSGSLSASSPNLTVKRSVSWSDGVGTTSVVGSVAETGDTLIWSDAAAQISQASNSFEVMDTICDGSGPCHAQDKKVSPDVQADANLSAGQRLGLGFNPQLTGSFSCNGSEGTAGNTAILLVDPVSGYEAGTTYDVTVTWSKAVSGTGPPSGFNICIGKPDPPPDGPYAWTLLNDCTSATDHPCIASEKRVQGGALQAVLQLDPSDPGFGGK